MNEQWIALRGIWHCFFSKRADFASLTFSVNYGRQVLAQEAAFSPGVHQHTQQNSQKYSSSEPNTITNVFLPKLCQTRVFKNSESKSSIVSSNSKYPAKSQRSNDHIQLATSLSCSVLEAYFNTILLMCLLILSFHYFFQLDKSVL